MPSRPLDLVPTPRAGRFLCLVILLAMAACRREACAPTNASKPPAPLRPIHAPGRVLALGDLHGDLTAARRALRVARVIDADDRWVGGTAVVVQTGDLLDRGDAERPLLEWLDRLAPRAAAAGGALLRVQGNHEVMNVEGDFRYVAEAGFADFAEYSAGPPLDGIPAQRWGRWRAFHPGGPWAKKLAPHPVVLQVNDSIFVHGGLLPSHARYGLARLNAELTAWMRGEGPLGPLLTSRHSPTWDRTYGDAVTTANCRALLALLSSLGAKRLVIGHTPRKEGISFACDGRVARIDVGVGLPAYGHQPAQVLEIVDGAMKVLVEERPPARDVAASGQR